MNKRERLTERVGDGIRYFNGQYEVTCYPKNDNLTPVDKLAVKLCDLEDKFEDGAVFTLPCKIGETVYVLMKTAVDDYDYKKGVNEITVRHIRIRSDGIFVSDFWGFIDWKFGERAFLTYEEAKTALAGYMK